MVLRQPGDDDGVVGVRVERRDDGGEVVAQAAVRDDDALGLGGGARGVLQEGGRRGVGRRRQREGMTPTTL